METNQNTKAPSTLRSGVEPPLLNYLYSKASRTATPLSGTFELTPRCNFDCKMCYVHLTKGEQTSIGRELDASKWLAIGEEACKNGMLMLLLTGGEPLLRPDFKEIYLGLKKMGLMISINSNGSLLDDDMLSFFKHNPPYKFNISLYGSSEDTYKSLCGVPGGFEKTVHALRTLKEYGVTVKINCSITNYNKSDFEGILDLGNDIGFNVQSAAYMFPAIRRSRDLIGTGNRLSSKEAAEMKLRANLIQLTDERFMKLATAVHEGKRVIDENNECLDLPTAQEETPTEHIRCRAGKCTFWITWDGRMLPCGMMEVPSVSVLELGFKEAWRRTHENTLNIYMPPKCTSCDKRFACDVCAAGCYAETGSFCGEAPEYICSMTEEYIRLVEAEYQKRTATGASAE